MNPVKIPLAVSNEAPAALINVLRFSKVSFEVISEGIISDCLCINMELPFTYA
jgi:hypothetical protein